MEKKRKWLGLSLWILMILLTGCGKNEVPETVPKEEPVDWKTKGFQCLEEVKLEQVLWEEKYQEWNHEMEQGETLMSHLDSDVCGAYCQGYLVSSGGMVVINADTKNPEGVRLFIEALFSKEVQKQSKHLCLSVRRRVLEDFVTMDEEGNAFFMGRHPILVYEDGTTAFHRAMEFLENCVAPPREYYHITKILFEELNTMYAEGKESKQVAEIINNRVQVYLDEGE